MNTSTKSAVATLLILSASGALAEGGSMMNGSMMNGNMWGGSWMRGGCGGWLIPVLLVVLIGVIVWAAVRRRK
jgi:hypothetical protein